MYGKDVYIKVNGEEVKVFVFCTPKTQHDELIRRAYNQYYRG
jgi:hypothetical protein